MERKWWQHETKMFLVATYVVEWVVIVAHSNRIDQFSHRIKKRLLNMDILRVTHRIGGTSVEDGHWDAILHLVQACHALLCLEK